MDLNTFYIVVLFTLLVVGIVGLIYQKIRDAQSPERKMTDAELDAALTAVGFPSTSESHVIESPAKTKHQSTSDQTEAVTPLPTLPTEPPTPLTLQDRVTHAVEQYGSAVEFVTSPAITHLLFIGETGAGKTALVHESARYLARKHPVERVNDHLVTGIIVCDPDHYPGKWPGCEVAGAGNDYDAIALACERVLHEYDLRVEAQSAVGIRTFEPVWLIIDEYWDIWHRDERIQRAVESILRRGRKLNVHLWIGSQDNQAASIGLAGETKLMKNFTYVCELIQGRAGVRFLHPKKYTDNGRNEPAGELRAVPWIEMPETPTHLTYREFITTEHRNTDLLTEILESPKASIEQVEEPENDDFTPSRIQDFKISDLRDTLTGEYDITEEEWALLIRCWQIYESNGQRKAAALQEAFGVRPGGTRNYQRASQLFDVLLRHRVLQST